VSLKARVRAGEFTLGSWITLGHPAIAEIMARAGFDWLVIDAEHSVMSIATIGELIRVIDLCGVAPLVRLTSNDPDQIKRVMDAGAHGVVVPMVNSVPDAARAVAATRYPPQGTRGAGLSRAQGYGAPGEFDRYFTWQRDDAVVIAQIEHIDAVKALEGILTEPGIDAFIVGPYDLSCSLGTPGQFETPAFVDAMRRIRDTAQHLGARGGLHLVEPDPLRLAASIADGFSFVAYSVDFRMLDVASRTGVSAARRP
jgi:2-dehydro-3-deoxyglucarate aldolase